MELKGSDGEIARVRLSDGSSFLVHGEILAREGLAVGDSLDEPRICTLKINSEHVFAKRSALALLARAAHTRKGLSAKLKKRGFGPEAIRSALARMIELGYLDDGAFADNWTRSRIASRREGWKALYRGLLSRGVPRKIAESVSRISAPMRLKLKTRAFSRLGCRRTPR